MQSCGAPAATAASRTIRAASEEHFCAKGWNPKIIGQRVLSAISDLKIAVEVGLVTGVTPATVTLKRGNGFFQPAAYDVTFKKEGFQTKTVQVTGTVNGWYVANIIFGGLIGLLIVDPATGAMYTLNPSDINAVLDENQTASQKGQQSLTVMLVQDIPENLMSRAKYITTL